jgi:hypothetical protein
VVRNKDENNHSEVTRDGNSRWILYFTRYYGDRDARHPSIRTRPESSRNAAHFRTYGSTGQGIPGGTRDTLFKERVVARFAWRMVLLEIFGSEGPRSRHRRILSVSLRGCPRSARHSPKPAGREYTRVLKASLFPSRLQLSLGRSACYSSSSVQCSSGGTGRRAGLKIRWPQGRVGSIPSSSTIYIRSVSQLRAQDHSLLHGERHEELLPGK